MHMATRRVVSAAAVTLMGVAGLGLVGTDMAAAAATRPGPGMRAAAKAGVVSNYTDPSISGPAGITAGPDGALWFTNQNVSSVERITTSGVVTDYTSASDSITWDITTGPDQALWFTNLGNNVIGRLSTAGVTTYYSDPSIIGPLGIATGSDGALWYTNNGNNSIGRLTTAGVASSYTSPTISDPNDITAGPDGDLWFTNDGNNSNGSIGRITTSGVITNYTDPTISQPVDITPGPDGALWFTNDGNNSIGRITTSGVVTNYTGPTISGPSGIAAGPDGAIWFTNYGNNSIGRITMSGVISNYTDPTISDPEGITAGSDGALWFTNAGNNSIGRITTAGTEGSQTIVFDSTPPQPAVVGGPSYTVSANGGESGNPVTFTVDPSASSVCSISGSVVDFIGAGTCVIDANQAGNSSYGAALQVQQRVTVKQEPPSITSPNSLSTSTGSPFSFTVTTMGDSTPVIRKRGSLPRQFRFTDNGDGTATLSGTPVRAGTYYFVIRATFGTGKTRAVAKQEFTLTVLS
jgi:virginiamycin B lyase